MLSDDDENVSKAPLNRLKWCARDCNVNSRFQELLVIAMRLDDS